MDTQVEKARQSEAQRQETSDVGPKYTWNWYQPPPPPTRFDRLGVALIYAVATAFGFGMLFIAIKIIKYLFSIA